MQAGKDMPKLICRSTFLLFFFNLGNCTAAQWPPFSPIKIDLAMTAELLGAVLSQAAQMTPCRITRWERGCHDVVTKLGFCLQDHAEPCYKTLRWPNNAWVRFVESQCNLQGKPQTRLQESGSIESIWLKTPSRMIYRTEAWQGPHKWLEILSRAYLSTNNVPLLFVLCDQNLLCLRTSQDGYQVRSF